VVIENVKPLWRVGLMDQELGAPPVKQGYSVCMAAFKTSAAGRLYVMVSGGKSDEEITSCLIAWLPVSATKSSFPKRVAASPEGVFNFPVPRAPSVDPEVSSTPAME
jgi:hypothetical protein